MEDTGKSFRESPLITLTGDIGEAIDLEIEGLLLLSVLGVVTYVDIEERDSALDEMEPC